MKFFADTSLEIPLYSWVRSKSSTSTDSTLASRSAVKSAVKVQVLARHLRSLPNRHGVHSDTLQRIEGSFCWTMNGDIIKESRNSCFSNTFPQSNSSPFVKRPDDCFRIWHEMITLCLGPYDTTQLMLSHSQCQHRWSLAKLDRGSTTAARHLPFIRKDVV